MSTISNTEYSPNLSSFSPSSCPKCYEASTKKLLTAFPGCFTAQAKLPRLDSASSVDRSKSRIGWRGGLERDRSRPILSIGKGSRTQTLPTQPATTKEQRRRRRSTNSSSVYPESRIDPTQRVLSILNRGSTRPERDGILQSAWNTYSDGLNVLVESEKQYETSSRIPMNHLGLPLRFVIPLSIRNSEDVRRAIRRWWISFVIFFRDA